MTQRLTFQAILLPLALFACDSLALSTALAQTAPRVAKDSALTPRLAFVGLHGGVFETLQKYASEAGVTVEYVTDEAIEKEQVPFGPFQVVFLQHVREEDADHYRKLILDGKKQNPKLRILSISGLAEKAFPKLAAEGVIEHDAELERYYGNSPENLRRLLVYVRERMLGGNGRVLPPEETAELRGLYHPGKIGLFKSVPDFLAWARSEGKKTEGLLRGVVTVHSTHLAFQQPKVVEALVKALEARGMLAVAMTDLGPQYEKWALEFRPDVVIHTCHSNETVEFRTKLGVPHLHSIFFRKQSIAQWRESLEGLAANEMAFQITGPELLGAIEPQIGAGTEQGGGSSESFVPVLERIDHLADRAVAWAKLAHRPKPEKKIAFIYYDREMGKAELMRGSATGMFMNGPRSLVGVLSTMKKAGYQIPRPPADEDELVALMMDHGRQIGVWAPGVLDRLGESRKAALVPVDKYREWFEKKAPQEQRENVISKWGPPPGKFLVWSRNGEEFIVIPRIELGNVTLLPQPLRGEAHDTSLTHDKLVPPPHNYLATYFWLQETLQPDAMVHFGTHGSEFILPGKPTGLSDNDWPDIIMGSIPNINPWVINNLGESSPVRRRAYAVLIDHLVPPSVNAELSDELLNLHNDIDKWIVLEDGALKEKFRATITQQVRAAKIDKDMKLELPSDQLLTPPQIEQTLAYLHEIHNETTPISLHILGQGPAMDKRIPWLVVCLGKSFLDALGKLVEVPAEEALTPGDSEKYLRREAQEAVKLLLTQNLTPEEAVTSVGGVLSAAPEAVEKVVKSLELAKQLNEGFDQTGLEVDNLLAALDGRFIPPGPGNSPDRNPGVLPTGRNMYVMNPEEVPTKPSWEIGKQLIDQLLAQQQKSKGRYPKRVAFTLDSFATFQDYGVMESQILYLMGVRPVWDSRNLVTDVELIPADELKRPRIDVFISSLGYYRDMLPTRMALLDKAVRLVSQTKAEDNYVYHNTQRVEKELQEKGIAADRAKILASARIFGAPPGQYGSAGYYYLVEKSGEWNSREDLMDTYLSFSRYAYTEGLWGEEAAEAYNRHIQGSEVLLRSWADRTRSPLSNKYDWYKGGSLSLAIKHLTGQEPEWFLSDVRDPDRAAMINAEDALRRDYRVRLFNRKWIEGMMKEGYAGADQISVHVSNTMGWKIMRENSVSDDIWEEIVNTYVRDSRNLHIREWFEAENPYAFQEVLTVFLETMRKGYWKPDEATRREIALAYAQSVARHGEGGGLRGGGNEKLEAFLESILAAPGNESAKDVLAEYRAKLDADSAAKESMPSTETAPTATAETETVEGQKLEPKESTETSAAPVDLRWTLQWLLPFSCMLLIALGYRFQRTKREK